jgi:hypothetical protein
MKSLRRFVMSLIVTLMVIGPALAIGEGDGPDRCDSASLASVLAIAQDQLTRLNEQLDGDSSVQEVLAAVAQIEATMAEVRSACPIILSADPVTFRDILPITGAADYYVYGRAGDMVTMTALARGDGDLVLTLFDSDGVLLFTDDDSSPVGYANPEILDLPLPADGTYRVVVSSYGGLGAEPVEYDLILSAVAGDGRVVESGALSYGDAVDAILLGGRTSSFTFDAQAGDIVTLTATSTSGDADLFMELYGPDELLLFSDDDSNPDGGRDPQIRNLPLPTDGTYRIVIRPYSGGEGSARFVLSVDRTGTSDGLPDGPVALLPGTPVDGVLFPNQVVEYTFEGAADNSITISVVTLSGDADMLLELYGPDGSLITTDDDSNDDGQVFDPRIAGQVLPASGTYRIVVTRSAYADTQSTARFEITVQQN